jgi:DNA primase
MMAVRIGVEFVIVVTIDPCVQQSADASGSHFRLVVETAVPSDESQDFRERVRGLTDIVGLISESVRLTPKRGGREYTGLCPFHDDHNPSFCVYPDRQTYRCWVCNEGGDCFTFVMKSDSLGFREALEFLARRANLEVPKTLRREAGGTAERATLMNALQWLEGLFHKELMTSPKAAAGRDYLKGRGFEKRTIDAYKVGFHPEEWDWTLNQAKGVFELATLEAAKVIARRESGNGYRDEFVGRVVFPIRNERGQPVSFSGRVLPDAKIQNPKYFNGHESLVFKKSRILFGLDQARPAIGQRNETLVVEGYTDCMALHQAGFTNVVGTMGTAMTEQQVSLLRRFAPKVVLVYDGDDAGIKAAERAIERLLPQEIDLRIVTIPDGLDPADAITQRGPDFFAGLVASAAEAWDFKREILEARHGRNSVDAKQRIVDEMLRLLVSVPENMGTVREGLLIARLAERMGIGESSLRDRFRELRHPAQGARTRPAANAETAQSNTIDAVMKSANERLYSGQLSREERYECDLLEALFVRPAAISWVAGELDTPFRHPGMWGLWQAIKAVADPTERPLIDSLMLSLEDPILKTLAVWFDASARTKDLEQKVQEMGVDSQGCPIFVRRAVERLSLLKEGRKHAGIARELRVGGDSPGTMDARAEELLKQAEAFHRRRAAGNADPPTDAA